MKPYETDVTDAFDCGNSVQMQALVVEKWSLLAWGLAEFGLGAKKSLERNWISGCHNLGRCRQRIQQSWEQCLKLLFMRRQWFDIRVSNPSYFVLKDVGKSKGNRQYLGFSVIPCHPKSLQVSLQALCRPCAAWQNCSTGFMSIEIPFHGMWLVWLVCGCGCFCHLLVSGRWNGGSSRWFGLSAPGSSDSLQRYRSQPLEKHPVGETMHVAVVNDHKFLR